MHITNARVFIQFLFFTSFVHIMTFSQVLVYSFNCTSGSRVCCWNFFRTVKKLCNTTWERWRPLTCQEKPSGVYKMQENAWRPWLHPGPSWGAYSIPPGLLTFRPQASGLSCLRPLIFRPLPELKSWLRPWVAVLAKQAADGLWGVALNLLPFTWWQHRFDATTVNTTPAEIKTDYNKATQTRQ